MTNEHDSEGGLAGHQTHIHYRQSQSELTGQAQYDQWCCGEQQQLPKKVNQILIIFEASRIVTGEVRKALT